MEFFSFSPLFFSIYFAVLLVALFIIVPYMTFWSLLSERHEATFDVLNITTLSARRIVYGKVANALIQILIFFTVVSPFIAFTSMLQGFRIFNISMMMTVAFFISLALSSIGVAASTLSTNRLFQGIISVILLGALFIFTAILILNWNPWDGWMLELFASEPLVEQRLTQQVLLFCGAICLFMLLYSWVALEFGVSRITFESDNRSTMMRISCLFLFVALCVTFASITASSTYIDQASIRVFFLLLAFHLAIISYFVSCEPIKLSRRIHNRISKIGIFNLFLLPFLPGAGRGFFYILLLIGIFLAYCFSIDLIYQYRIGIGSSWRIADGKPLLMVGMVPGLFVLLYACIAIGLSSLLRHRFKLFHSGHIRLMVLVIGAAFAIIPFSVHYMINYKNPRVFDYNLAMLFNPFATISQVIDPIGTTYTLELILVGLGIATLFVSFLAIKPVIDSVAEVISKPQPSRLEDIERAMAERESASREVAQPQPTV